jgi:hypothetical protein
MARIYGITNPTPGRIQVFYVGDQAVGQGCPNRSDDVLLVQFFLRVIFDNDKEINPALHAGLKKPMSIDGSWGTQSQSYLKAWEAHMTATDPVIRADGRVDPVLSGTTVGSISKSIYKICIMNGRYGQLKGIPAHSNISRDPLFPAALKKSLFVSVS